MVTLSATVYVLIDGQGDNNSYLYRLKQDRFLGCPSPTQQPDCRGRYTENVDYWTWREDTASPESLLSFITHSFDDYKTSKNDKNPEQIILSIVGHGNGWSPAVQAAQPTWYYVQPTDETPYEDGMAGAIWDDSHQQSMSTKGLGVALAQATEAIGQQIDFLYMDACSMGLLEVIYEVKDSVQYILVSENTTWAAFSYDQLLQAIDGSKDALEIGLAWLGIEADIFTRTGGHPFTLSLIDLAQMTLLREKHDALSTALMATLPAGKAQVEAALNGTDCFESQYDGTIGDEDSYCDLKSFASALQTQFSGNTDVVNTATELIAAVDQAVVKERHGGGNPWVYPGANWEWHNLGGIGIDLPLHATGNQNKRAFYNEEHLRFAKDGLWDNFLASYWDNTQMRSARVEALPACDSTEACDELGQSLDMKPEVAVVSDQEVESGETASVAIDFINNGSEVSEATFSVQPDNTCLEWDSNDSNGDGIPDSVTLAQLDGFATTVTINGNQFNFTIHSTNTPATALPDTNVATLALNATCYVIEDTDYPVQFPADSTTFKQADGKELPAMTTDGVVTVLASTPEAEVSLTLSPEITSVKIGETFDVDIWVHAETQLVDVAVAYLDFDTQYLQVTNLVGGDTLTFEAAHSFDNQTGEIALGYGTLGDYPTDSFRLGTITFEAIAETDEATALSFNRTSPRLSDVVFQGHSILGSVIDGKVDIEHVQESITTTYPATVTATIQFVDRPAPPDANLSQSFTLILTPTDGAGTSQVLAVTTDNNGQFTVGNIVSGTYTILLESPQTKPTTMTNVSLTSGANNITIENVQDKDGTLIGEVKFPWPQSNEGWVRPISVTMTSDNTQQSYALTTDQEGKFEVTGLPAGTYQVKVWTKGTIPSEEKEVTIIPGGIENIDFGTLAAGDADGNGYIDINDFSIVKTALGTCSGDDGFDHRGDFDDNACVLATDFSMWLTSFRAQSDTQMQRTIQAASQEVAQYDGTVSLLMAPETITVNQGTTFNVTLTIDAGTQPVDAAAAYLNYNTEQLRVLDVTSGNTLDQEFINRFDNDRGHIDFAAGSLSTEPSGTYTLYTITFEALTDLVDTPVAAFNYTQPRMTNIVHAGDSVMEEINKPISFYLPLIGDPEESDPGLIFTTPHQIYLPILIR